MTEKPDWELLAVRLVGIVRRNVTGWQQNFTTRQILALKESWNDGVMPDDPDYWH